MPVGDSGPGIVQLIRMMLDPNSAKKTEQEMKDSLDKGSKPDAAVRNVGMIEGAFQKLGRTIKTVVAFMVARALVRSIVNFGKEAVKAALDARQQWALLTNALQNAGVNFENVRGEVEKLADQFQRAGIMGDEEFASTLTTLVQLSGDYEKSLRNVGVVADFAAARNLDLETAAVIVGRVMNGNTEILSRYGIEVKKGTDGVAALAEQFRGAAAAQDPAVRMQKVATEEWGNFQEAVGEALMAVRNGESLFGLLIDIIRSLTNVVKTNSEGIAIFGESLTWLVRGPLWVVLKAYEGWALLLATVAQGLAKLPGILDSNRVGLEAWAASAVKAADATRAVADAIAGKGTPASGLGAAPTGPIGGAVTLAGMGKKDKTPEELAREAQQEMQQRIQNANDALQFDELRAQGLQRLIDLQNELNIKLQDESLTFEERLQATQNLQQVNEALIDGLKRVAAEAGISGEALELMVKGSGRAALAEIAKEAKGRVLWNIAKAVEMFARGVGFLSLGNIPSAAAAKTAGKMHLGAAAKWGAVAGGLSAIAGGGGGEGGGGGAGTTPDNLGGDAASAAQIPGVQVTVYVDGVNPNSTAHQALVAQTNQQIKERYGEDSQITVLPMSSAPPQQTR